MSQIAFVEARPADNSSDNAPLVPLNANCYAAWDGFALRGFDVRLFTRADLPNLPLAPDTVVAGNIATVRAALRQIGAPLPPYLLLPRGGAPFLGRASWETTLGEVRTLAHVPVFIKPLSEGKTFTGHVVSAFRDLLETAVLPDDLPVLAQGVVEFVSEWRVFVTRGEVVGVGRYRGHPLRFPDANVIRAVVAAYNDPVAAYSVDIGVTASGDTLLIELNDGYSLGAYGLPPARYARLLEARWDEMTATKQEPT